MRMTSSAIIFATLTVAIGLYFFTVFWPQNNLPPELVLKTDKFNILASKEIESAGEQSVVRYDYVSHTNVPPTRLDETESEIAGELRKAELTNNVVTIYGNPLEDMSKRTANARFYKIALARDTATSSAQEALKEVWRGVFYGGRPLYKRGDTWYEVKFATTTTQAFYSQTRLTILDGVKMFFGQKALATDYYSTTADGEIHKNNQATWTLARNSASGTAVSTDVYQATAMKANLNAGEYGVGRAFFYFDTYSIGSDATVTAASISIYGRTNAESTISAQKGTQADVLATTDFQAFSGTYYGISGAWTIDAYNTITFNAQGVADINKTGITKICTREYNHDYLNVEPTDFYRNGCTFAEGTNMPYLSVTYTVSLYTPIILRNGTIFRNNVILR